ncbi:Omp28-related outer membrane protein [Aureivirga sp. CE67]|uniref:T9SS type A sorting domain-containing protein n=1 Tax=Aureivirga sp. CE67 TaxID=1788983 RepID=UPI0018C98F48|nr:Omp28-related outer membrane protein [Aureivirga sp. CE67]
MIKKITSCLALAMMITGGLNAQTVHHSDDFEDYLEDDLGDWTNYDVNEDTYTWQAYEWNEENGILGMNTIYSLSGGYTQDGAYVELDPDNILTSPAYSLPSENPDQLILTFNYFTVTNDPDLVADKLSVYVTTSNAQDDIIDATPLFTTILENDTMNTAYINLSDFAGQDVYISFRHYDCPGNYVLFVDNMSIQTQPQYDVEIAGVGVPKYNEQSTDTDLAFAITNNGADPVTSYELKWSDGDGTEYTETFTPETGIALGESTSFTEPEVFTNKVNYASLVNKTLTVEVVSVNGNTDENDANDSQSAKYITVSEKPSKKVLFEAMNGVWMEEADSPSAALDYMKANSAEFIGIAVHQDESEDGATDPFQVEAYTEAAGLLATGMHADRISTNIASSQENMESLLESYKEYVSPSTISVETDGDDSSVAITVSADLKATMQDEELRIAVVITEDNVDHDGTPYNHVAKAILGTYDGLENSIDSNDLVDGQTATYTFNYAVPQSSNFDNMNVVAMIIDQADGTVLNSEITPLKPTIGINEFSKDDIKLSAFPNPATDNLTVSFDGQGDYLVMITDMLGKVVHKENVLNISGQKEMKIGVSDIATGNYILSVSNNTASYNKNITIK